MDYFHRRNRPPLEYSGHEEVSEDLRRRLLNILREYLRDISVSDYHLSSRDFLYLCQLQFPTATPPDIFAKATYERVFTIVEVLFDCARELDAERRLALRNQLAEAFRLSGSVYELRGGKVCLVPSDDTARKLTEVAKVLEPYDDCAERFFSAVGDLMGRKRKSDDIVKDLFIAAEGYLKNVTSENDFVSAVKALHKTGALNAIQRGVMEKLHGYRSDARGVGHAGNSPTPNERDALWFLETLLVQLTHIDRSQAR